jgi:hypothetical protein
MKQMRNMPSVMKNDPNYIRIRYLRYADDWVIGVCGNKQLAERIKADIKDFLFNDLKLRLSEEKTHITNARTEEAHFLGTRLSIGWGKTPKIVLTTSPQGTRYKRRSTGWETVMKAPIPKLIKRLVSLRCGSNCSPV